MRLAVPSLKKLAKLYISGEVAALKAVYGEGGFYYHKDTPGERFNYFLREWGHRIVYDEQMLCDLLKESGFKTATPKEKNESSIPGGWWHDRLEGESLYVEAQK